MMFLDIRDFTTFSERKRPEEVVEYLNRLFDFMIDSVNRHQGIVNKFLGDGFMAVFGAPISDGGDCRHAVAASRIEQLNKQFSSRLLVSDAVLAGIGEDGRDAVLLGPTEVKGHEAPVQVYRLA